MFQSLLMDGSVLCLLNYLAVFQRHYFYGIDYRV
uniref:Uncharacterized protein n=1 Tax=Anguilla anguilla TaxID=7936 RepID=A0A0E9RBN9_ANGAN